MSKSKHRRTGRNPKGRRKPGRRPRNRSAKPILIGAVAGTTLIAVVGVFAMFLTRPHIPDFDGDRALADVEKLVDLGPRVPGTQPHAAALEFLRSRLDPLADQVSFQQVFLRLPEGDTVWGTNLIASFNLQPSQNVRIMLGAHWDSRPYADRDPNPSNRDKPIPGANDGASGSAVLLEMARLLHAQPPEIGVDMLFFDLEDMGLDSTVAFSVGSEQFAESNDGYHPTFGIVLDMVCDRNLRLPKETSSVQAARRIVDLVWEAAHEEKATAFLDQVGGAVTDDHIPFLRRGIPVIDVIQSPFPDYWHTTADTPDKCSAESLEQVGRVVARVVYTL